MVLDSPWYWVPKEDKREELIHYGILIDLDIVSSNHLGVILKFSFEFDETHPFLLLSFNGVKSTLADLLHLHLLEGN